MTASHVFGRLHVFMGAFAFSGFQVFRFSGFQVGMCMVVRFSDFQVGMQGFMFQVFRFSGFQVLSAPFHAGLTQARSIVTAFECSIRHAAPVWLSKVVSTLKHCNQC